MIHGIVRFIVCFYVCGNISLVKLEKQVARRVKVDKACGQLGAIMQAVFVRSLYNFDGEANLYRVDPPVTYPDENPDSGEWQEEGGNTEYVIVYASNSPNATRIFPADEQGEVLSWSELPGSYRGGLDHKEALIRAGYTVQD